jgi:hypothetical protein
VLLPLCVRRGEWRDIMFMNRRSKEQRTSGDDGFTVFQNGNGRNIERSSLLPSSSATPASAAGRFRGVMDNSAYPDDGVCVFFFLALF